METKVQDNVPRRASLPPGQASARAAGRSMLAMAMLLLLMWCVPQRAMAADANQISIESHINDGGYILVTIPVYDNDGKDDALNVDYSSYIAVNDTKVLWLRSTDEGNEAAGQHKEGYRWVQMYKTTASMLARIETEEGGVWKEVTATSSHSTNEFNYREVGYISYATFRIYLSVEQLKSKNGDGKVSIDLYFDDTGKVGGGDNYHVSKEVKINYTLPSTPTLNVDFSQNPGYQSVSFSGTQDDKYKITGNSQTVVIGNNGNINIDYAVQNTERVVSLTYYKKFSQWQYVDVTSSTTIPAYQHPTDFKATQLADGDVKVTWSIAAYSGSVVTGGDFEVQRSKDEKFATVETVGTLAFEGAKSYSLTDDVSEKNLNGKYYYRLRRTNAAAWNWGYVKTTSIDLSMKHKKIATARGENTEDGQVKLTWTYDGGNIWSDNSNVMVVRTNTNKGTSTTYAIADDMGVTSYTETLPTTCDVYSYTIYVQPGNSVYSTQSPVEVKSNGNLYSSEMGYIKTVTASKGYYSDRVSLEWEIEGGVVDQFSIRAREYGSNGDWKQIEQISANVASTSYQYSDTKAVPGVIYEYQIVAVKNCGGGNDQVPYEGEIIGFRTPTGNIYGRVTFENGQAVAGVEVRAEMAEGEGIAGKAYVVDSNDYLKIDNARLLQEATATATLEAWIRPEAAGTIIKKAGMYELLYKGGKIAFKVGSQEVTSASSLSIYTQDAPYVHVAAVADEDYLYIYLNGVQEARTRRTATVTGNANQVVMV